MVVQFIGFLTLSTLICRGTDISKCFSESLGIRDNESRLYKLLDEEVRKDFLIAKIRHLTSAALKSNKVFNGYL